MHSGSSYPLTPQYGGTSVLLEPFVVQPCGWAYLLPARPRYKEQELGLSPDVLSGWFTFILLHEVGAQYLSGVRDQKTFNSGDLSPIAITVKPLLSGRLDANLISLVPERSFEGLSSLRHLWLDDNALTEIPVRALNNLPALQAMTLALNHIRRIPDYAFQNLTSLVVLHLHNNLIQHVGTHSFEGLHNLETLHDLAM
ncbi:leucine-rich repeat-containing G-protein coupled receptor [Cricetulus griseus]|nr:leucine-rich repeat-containing G-protein coupled receptor [Cricetulus griseus]